MRKLAAFTLFLVVMLSTVTYFATKPASASVSGILTSDTTWTRAQSPIGFNGPVCVNNGVTLIIEPGVTVNLHGYNLVVNGSLTAIGTNDKRILFTGTTVSTASVDARPQIQFKPSSTDSIIKNANFNVVTITIEGDSPKISSNLFQKPATVTIFAKHDSSAYIENNYFDHTDYGVYIYGSTVFEGNMITGVVSNTAINCGDNSVISNNTVTECKGAAFASEHVSITKNAFYNNRDNGIINRGDGLISGNYIANNTVGIDGNGIIQSNTIIDNDVGIKSPNASINNNNIVGNNQSIYMTSPNNIDATNNWWGATDSQAISKTIWDYNDDFGLGKVTYTPILTRPSSSAPSYPKQLSSSNPGIDSLDGYSYGSQMEDIILVLAWIVPVALAVGWGIAVAVLVLRRRRK